jgi:hypothetical protein
MTSPTADRPPVRRGLRDPISAKVPERQKRAALRTAADKDAIWGAIEAPEDGRPPEARLSAMVEPVTTPGDSSASPTTQPAAVTA